MDNSQVKEEKRKFSLIAWLFGRKEDNTLQIKKKELMDALDRYEECLKATKKKIHNKEAA
jgi:hypothetical protein